MKGTCFELLVAVENKPLWNVLADRVDIGVGAVNEILRKRHQPVRKTSTSSSAVAVMSAEQ